MPSAEVYVLGQKYTIKGDKPEKHVQSLARDINKRISDVCSKFPNMAPNQAMILTLFNMADELDKLNEEQEIIAKNIQERAESLARLFE